MLQTFISRNNSILFSDKLVLTSVTPASSAPVLQTPKATSSTLYFYIFFSSRSRHTISVSAFLLNRSSDLDKQASHFVHIPGLSYSGVKSPTECQQSLFESHFASRQSLSDCPVAF